MKKKKYIKHRKGRNKGIENKSNKIKYLKYGIQSISRGKINKKHIEISKKIFSKYTKRKGKMICRINLNKNITKKPLEVRMGNGKGEIVDTIANIKPGKIIYEISNIPKNKIILVTKKINNKLPINIKYISNNEKHTLNQTFNF